MRKIIGAASVCALALAGCTSAVDRGDAGVNSSTAVTTSLPARVDGIPARLAGKYPAVPGQIDTVTSRLTRAGWHCLGPRVSPSMTITRTDCVYRTSGEVTVAMSGEMDALQHVTYYGDGEGTVVEVNWAGDVTETGQQERWAPDVLDDIIGSGQREALLAHGTKPLWSQKGHGVEKVGSGKEISLPKRDTEFGNIWVPAGPAPLTAESLLESLSKGGLCELGEVKKDADGYAPPVSGVVCTNNTSPNRVERAIVQIRDGRINLVQLRLPPPGVQDEAKGQIAGVAQALPDPELKAAMLAAIEQEPASIGVKDGWVILNEPKPDGTVQILIVR